MPDHSAVAVGRSGTAGDGPFTSCSSRFDSRRPSVVQMAPTTKQWRLCTRTRVTLSRRESGATSISQWSLRLFTRLALVTLPPATAIA